MIGIIGMGVAVWQEPLQLNKAGTNLFAPLIQFVCLASETFVLSD